jgi:hypothetical protein
MTDPPKVSEELSLKVATIRPEGLSNSAVLAVRNIANLLFKRRRVAREVPSARFAASDTGTT